MTERDNWHVIGFAFGVMACAIVGIIMSVSNPRATLNDYARAMLWTFGVAFAFGAMLYVASHEGPSLWAALWLQVRQAEQMRYEAAQFAHKRKSHAFDIEGPHVVISHLMHLWHKWHTDVAQACHDKARGEPHYSGAMDSVMEWRDWRVWADQLVREGILEPIQSSVKTKWRSGWNVDRLLDRLSNGWTPSCPEEAPPILKQDNS